LSKLHLAFTLDAKKRGATAVIEQIRAILSAREETLSGPRNDVALARAKFETASAEERRFKSALAVSTASGRERETERSRAAIYDKVTHGSLVTYVVEVSYLVSALTNLNITPQVAQNGDAMVELMVQVARSQNEVMSEMDLVLVEWARNTVLTPNEEDLFSRRAY
jgi:hypothetical protein